jgi:ribosomal protein L13
MTTLEKTFAPKGREINRDWFVVDATDKVLGRLAKVLPEGRLVR